MRSKSRWNSPGRRPYRLQLSMAGVESGMESVVTCLLEPVGSALRHGFELIYLLLYFL